MYADFKVRLIAFASSALPRATMLSSYIRGLQAFHTIHVSFVDFPNSSLSYDVADIQIAKNVRRPDLCASRVQPLLSYSARVHTDPEVEYSKSPSAKLQQDNIPSSGGKG